MKNFIITQQLGDELITYLSKRPWIEVEALIHALQASKELEDNKNNEDN